MGTSIALEVNPGRGRLSYEHADVYGLQLGAGKEV